MLILRRKKNESFLIGNDIRVTIIECASDGARIAIDAPKHISILREELSEAEQANLSSVAPSAASLQSLHNVISRFVAVSVSNNTDSSDRKPSDMETKKTETNNT